MKKVMRFGEYLIDRKIITEKNLLEALEHQHKHSPLEEKLAVDLGILTESEAFEINTARQDTGSTFLSIAHELGYINDHQKQQVIREQNHRKPHIGEVLVRMGLSSTEAMNDELVRFRKKIWEYQEIRNDLKKMMIFHELEENILYHLAYLPKRISLKKGEILFKEGEFPNSFCCVLSGELLITKNQGEGKKVVVARINQYDAVGESAMLKKDKRTASAIAETDLVLYEFKKEDFHRFLRSHTKASYTILLYIANSLLTKLHITNDAYSMERLLHADHQEDKEVIY